MTLFLTFLAKHWKLVAFAAIAGALYLYGEANGYGRGEKAGNAAVAKILAERAQEKITEANQRATYAEDRAKRYQAKAEAQEAIVAQYLQELDNANARADRTVADIRSGYVKLRSEWRCPKVPATGQAPADPGQPESDTGLQAASVGRIDRAVSSCAAHVKALLNLAECDRGDTDKCRENG